MKTVHNPYYGIGEAKHHYIRLCGKCDYAPFVPEALVKQHREAQLRHSRPSTPTRKSWFTKKKE